jgi:release factor glutamine methyltransferase
VHGRPRLWTPLELIKVTSEFLAENGVPAPRLDAELLLGHVLGLSRLQLYLEHERPIVPAELDRFRELVRGRARRVPLQILIGEVELLGHRFVVRQGVFIPRPETETLLLVCTNLEFHEGAPATIVEVGPGTGCIGLSLLLHWPRARLLAVDASMDAIELSRENARLHRLQDRCEFRRADARTSELPSCDLLVSNPPYIPTADLKRLEPEVREYDPVAALDGGTDGLEMIRWLSGQAIRCLHPGGWIVLEHGFDQGESAPAALAEAGLVAVEDHRDLGGQARVAVGRRSPR